MVSVRNYNFFKDASYKEQVARSNTWGHHFVFLNILLALVSSFTYVYASPHTDTFLSFLYLILTYVGHTSFLLVMVFLCIFFPLSFIGNYRYYRVFLVIIAIILHTVLLFDLKLYLTVKIHLSLTTLNLMFTSLDFKTGLNYNFLYIAIPIVIIAELAFAKMTTNYIYKPKHSNTSKFIGIFLFSCFISSHALHIWADAANYDKITALRSVFPAHYPTTAKTFLISHGYIDKDSQGKEVIEEVRYPLSNISYDKNLKTYNIFYINVNGLSYDDINEDNTKNLLSLMKDSLSYSKFYLPYREFESNLFATTYSLPLSLKASVLKDDLIPVTVNLMQRNEYKIKLVSSDVHSVTQITENTNLRDTQVKQTKSDLESLNYIKTSLDTLNSEESHFYTVFLNDLKDNSLSRYRYNKKLQNLDIEIASLVKKIKESKVGNNSLIVISSLEGNNFYSDITVTYARKKQHVPLFFIGDNIASATRDNLASSFDLVPTIASNILKVKNRSFKYSIGNDLNSMNTSEFIVSDKPALLLIYKDYTTVYLENGHSFIENKGVKQEVKPKLEDLIEAMQILNRFKE